MSLREKLTHTEMQDLVARALVRSGNVIPSAKFPAFCDQLRTVLIAALEYGSQRPEDCDCDTDSADHRAHAHDCVYYLRMTAAAPRRERE